VLKAGIGIPIKTDPMETNEAKEATHRHGLQRPMKESWDAVKNQQHSELQECRARTSPNSGHDAKEGNDPQIPSKGHLFRS